FSFPCQLKCQIRRPAGPNGTKYANNRNTSVTLRIVYPFRHRVTCPSQIAGLASYRRWRAMGPRRACSLGWSIAHSEPLFPRSLPDAHSPDSLHRRSTATNAAIKHASKSHKSAHASIRHDAMESERATEIQQALIKNGYLNGEPSGV